MILQAFTVVLWFLQLVYVGGSNLTETFHNDGCSKDLLDAAVELIKKGSSLNRKCSEENGAKFISDAALDLIEKAKGCTVTVEKDYKAVDCEEILKAGFNKSGNYTIWPRGRINEEIPLHVYCDMETDGGGWTVIQRRGDFGKPEDYFYKDWSSYKSGFGNINEDFWLGNDNIFALTNQKLCSVRIDLKSFQNEKRFAKYDTFWIDDESNSYTLFINKYSGDAGDSFMYHNNMKFSTKDVKNDRDLARNCAKTFKGGWWYNRCQHCNLNGLYLRGKPPIYENGIIWKTWKGFLVSLDTIEIKIRSRSFKKKA